MEVFPVNTYSIQMFTASITIQKIIKNIKPSQKELAEKPIRTESITARQYNIAKTTPTSRPIGVLFIYLI